MPLPKGAGSSTTMSDRAGGPPERTVLFVCRHGAAKSVLAAADFRRLALERGLDVDAIAAGVEPDAEVTPVLVRALPADSLGDYQPREVTAADLARASRVITFNLAPEELPISNR